MATFLVTVSELITPWRCMILWHPRTLYVKIWAVFLGISYLCHYLDFINKNPEDLKLFFSSIFSWQVGTLWKACHGLRSHSLKILSCGILKIIEICKVAEPSMLPSCWHGHNTSGSLFFSSTGFAQHLWLLSFASFLSLVIFISISYDMGSLKKNIN